MATDSNPALPAADRGRRQFLRGLAAAACWCGTVGLVRAQGVGMRGALVIGNGDYGSAPLRNPVNDARLIGATLTDLGYSVTAVENATMSRTLDAARYWITGTRGYRSRVFYFAGHGLQSRGKNFLIPVDADIRGEDEVPRKAVNVMEIVEQLSRLDDGVSIVILDACRNSPFPLMAGNVRARGVGEPDGAGLAPADAPRGTLIAYSTSPGSVAVDGAHSAHSVYTQALAEEMRAEGVPIELMFKRVRQRVIEQTRHAQVPWESSSLVGGDFCFRPTAQGACGTAASAGAVPDARTVDLRRMKR
jgi:uncharacterized caspase-like protein